MHLGLLRCLLADGRKRHKVLIKLQETGNSTRQPHHHDDDKLAVVVMAWMWLICFECL
jgi:hypothetical protein